MIHKPTQREKRKARDKQARKERNYVAVTDIYARATQSAMYDYIDRSSSPERVEKIKAVAQARRDRRNGKRLAVQQ